MKSTKKHIYFVPGTAANAKIFERLALPEALYECHYLEWMLPSSKDETIEDYAGRLCQKIKHQNPILVGVSFGGVMVQEMAKHIACEKIVLISSIKSHHELSNKMQFIRDTKAYRLFPSRILNSILRFIAAVSTSKTTRRLEQYQMYLSFREPLYLNWAIKQVLQWKQTSPLPNTIHIHGTNDFIFPIHYIKNCISIEKGTHIMIVTKAKTISAQLLKNLV